MKKRCKLNYIACTSHWLLLRIKKPETFIKDDLNMSMYVHLHTIYLLLRVAIY